jgi:hypothetical protein
MCYKAMIDINLQGPHGRIAQLFGAYSNSLIDSLPVHTNSAAPDEFHLKIITSKLEHQ